MNDRLYDPVVGRFLSPDSYIQDPGFTQSYNRYSYCLNNPLKYNDPSGEFWGVFAVWLGNYVAGWLDNTINKKMSPKQALQQTPIMISGSYSPSTNTLFNQQWDFYRAAKHEELVSQKLDQFVAGQSGLGDFGTGLSLAGEGIWLFGEKRSLSLYQQGFRRGLSGNYQLAGRNLSLFGDMPMTSATKPFTRLSSLGKGLSNFGTGLAVASVAIDTYDYKQGNISGARYSSHLTGTSAAIAAAYFGGGPIGAVTGSIFFLGEKAWDGVQPIWEDIVHQYWQFENALNNGWRPR